ncbi:MAG: endonuclease domain-containing protein [Cyclobacteriaceae bacterium]
MKYKQALQYARELRKNQTRAEKFFWMQVRKRRFKGLKFNRQFIIEHQNNSYFIADFYCHQYKLIVEIDGEVHKYQKEYDSIREDILKNMKFKIVRFSNEEVLKNWDKVEKNLVAILSDNTSLS